MEDAKRPRLGCCAGALVLGGLVVVALVVLLVYPYADDPLASLDLPGAPVPVYIDLGPQTSTTITPIDPSSTLYEAPSAPTIVRISDAELTGLLKGVLPARRLEVRGQEGRLLVRGEAPESVQADAWLVVEGGHLQLRLWSLVWQGHSIPRPLLSLLAGQVNAQLTGLFPQAEVAAIEVHDGEVGIIIRPLGQAPR
ncbi:MAG: hypothetical protein M1337_03655 [Actinobacteria bacterium]|nr:hypothetical protein [Actinomycetota bacterium]MCL5025728.1 hypothetical protein [Chloroflexota bacterium]